MHPTRSTLVLALALALVLAPSAARAGGITAPTGFNVETVPAAGPIAAVLPDGTVLLDTGAFPTDELSVRQPDGSVTLFATGFGGIAGIAQSPITGDIVVGDSAFAPALHVLRDLNADGDALDPNENLPHPVALPVLANGHAPLPFDLAFRPGTDELYVSGSTTFLDPPTLGVVVRIAGGSASIFADGLGFPAGLVWSGDSLFTANSDSTTFAGSVIAFKDANADADALDPGEAPVFAADMSGASDLVRAQDGSFYLSGTTGPGFVGSVTHLLPDGDGDGLSDDVNQTWAVGFGFSGNLTLMEGGAGLQPGVGGDGTLAVQDFGFAGDVLVRSAPLATLQLTGTVANNAAFDLIVGGETGAGAIVVLSLDQVGITLHGIGDLALGFGAPYVIATLAPIGGASTSTTHIVLHGVPGAVGLHFTTQGFTVQGGEIGIGNAIQSVVAP